MNNNSTDLSNVSESLAKKMYSFLKDEIYKIDNIPNEEKGKLAIGSIATLAAMIIEYAINSSHKKKYKEEYFYHDVSVILNKFIRRK